MSKKGKWSLFFVFIMMAFFMVAIAEAKINISRSPEIESWAPRLALDYAGNVHVIWLELYTSNQGDIFYSRYDAASKTWSQPINLSNSGNVFSQSLWAHDIAVDYYNRVYVVWVEKNVLKMRICEGAWGSEFVVHSGGWTYDSPRLAVSFDGDIYIIWWTEDGVIWAKSRVGGEWEAAQSINSPGSRAKFPDIAVGRNIAAACWMERGSGENWYQIVYSQRSRKKNSSWTRSQIVAPADNDQQHGAIILDYLDRAHIVCTPEIQMATRQVYYVSGTLNNFSRSEPISSIENIHYPFIAEAGGNIYVCWQAGPYGDGIGVFYNIKRDDKWVGEKFVPETFGATYCDLAISQDESTLYVTWDGGGEIYVTSINLPITNRPPIADFTYSPTSGEIPLKVTFDASPSYDPDGHIVSYEWSFGDGGTGTGKIIDYTYKTEGSFPVQLIVTDDKGKKGLAIKYVQTIHVVYPPTNLAVKIVLSGIRKNPEVTYHLSWSPNPKNADEFVKEYRIYKKEGSGDFRLFDVVGKTTTSVKYNLTSSQKITWAISTFSILNKESPLEIFK